MRSQNCTLHYGASRGKNSAGAYCQQYSIVESLFITLQTLHRYAALTLHAGSDHGSIVYTVAQNKIPHQTICNIFASRGQILKILEAV